MSSFDYQIQCDELTDYRPTESDLAEYAGWCDEQDNAAANAWQDAEDDLQQDEYDGQPDEMQEWHDFDPDCQCFAQTSVLPFI